MCVDNFVFNHLVAVRSVHREHTPGISVRKGPSVQHKNALALTQHLLIALISFSVNFGAGCPNLLCKDSNQSPIKSAFALAGRIFFPQLKWL